MKHFFKLSVGVGALFLLGSSAYAEVKGSSRNLQPLTKKTDDSEASSRSGNTGLGIRTQPSEKPAETSTQVTFRGPKSGWGFVQISVPFYSPKGKNLGTLPSGTCFKYTDVETSATAALLVSTVKRGDAWEGPYLLGCRNLALFQGSPDALDPESLQNLTDYFALLGKIAERKASLAQASRTDNPHFESARRAQQAYQASIVKAGEMEKQLAALTGTRKTKADEELRALKYEQVRLKTTADREAADYNAWNEAHPGKAPQPAADSQLRELEQALQAAKAKVANLLPQS